ncbi:MAG: hypothetical protein ACYDHP_00625 [Ferrimicrobium sp.]
MNYHGYLDALRRDLASSTKRDKTEIKAEIAKVEAMLGLKPSSAQAQSTPKVDEAKAAESNVDESKATS